MKLLMMVKRNRVRTSGNGSLRPEESVEVADLVPSAAEQKVSQGKCQGRVRPWPLFHHGISYTRGSGTELNSGLLDRASGPQARVDHSQRLEPFVEMGRRVTCVCPARRCTRDVFAVTDRSSIHRATSRMVGGATRDAPDRLSLDASLRLRGRQSGTV